MVKLMIDDQKTVSNIEMDKNIQENEEFLPEMEAVETPDFEAEQQALIQKFELELGEMQDKVLRGAAEVENTRRRYEKMIEETRDYAITSFARDLMGVMDNLYRALEYKPKQAEDNEVQNFILGVELINNELQNSFNKYGIVRILPQAGEKFDYNIHQAVSQMPTNDLEPGRIVSIMQAGYKIKDRLLRPAMVTVSIANNE